MCGTEVCVREGDGGGEACVCKLVCMCELVCVCGRERCVWQVCLWKGGVRVWE